MRQLELFSFAEDTAPVITQQEADTAFATAAHAGETDSRDTHPAAGEEMIVPVRIPKLYGMANSSENQAAGSEQAPVTPGHAVMTGENNTADADTANTGEPLTPAAAPASADEVVFSDNKIAVKIKRKPVAKETETVAPVQETDHPTAQPATAFPAAEQPSPEEAQANLPAPVNEAPAAPGLSHDTAPDPATAETPAAIETTGEAEENNTPAIAATISEAEETVNTAASAEHETEQVPVPAAEMASETEEPVGIAATVPEPVTEHLPAPAAEAITAAEATAEQPPVTTGTGTKENMLPAAEEEPESGGLPEPEMDSFTAPAAPKTTRPAKTAKRAAAQNERAAVIKTIEPITQAKKRGRKSFKEIDAELDLVNVPDDDALYEKQYYPISTVAGWFNVNTSLLRYWENEFDILRPRKNRKGDRLFRPEDVKNLQVIYYLLRQRKFTIEGAKEYLKANRKKADTQTQLVQSLTKFRSFLLELKAHL
jgi:DNA-binding transcriptional MerR regulator